MPLEAIDTIRPQPRSRIPGRTSYPSAPEGAAALQL
jgi:hypothetical protein